MEKSFSLFHERGLCWRARQGDGWAVIASAGRCFADFPASLWSLPMDFYFSPTRCTVVWRSVHYETVLVCPRMTLSVIRHRIVNLIYLFIYFSWSSWFFMVGSADVSQRWPEIDDAFQAPPSAVPSFIASHHSLSFKLVLSTGAILSSRDIWRFRETVYIVITLAWWTFRLTSSSEELRML